MLDIERLLDRWPRQLSGGERQRVALGRAIVRNPSLFLMDEPLSNLDAKLRVQMRREIIRLQRVLGTTTIYVTHDQVEAMTMGDRIMVLRFGRIQQVGPPEELYNYPANVFVAGFIGSPAMNVSPGRLEGEADGLALVTRSGRLPLPPQIAARLRTNGRRGRPSRGYVGHPRRGYPPGPGARGWRRWPRLCAPRSTWSKAWAPTLTSA